MKKWLLLGTLLFFLLIIAIIIAADADQFPDVIKRLYQFPNGDKAGHFILFGILSFLLSESALTLFPKPNPGCLDWPGRMEPGTIPRSDDVAHRPAR